MTLLLCSLSFRPRFGEGAEKSSSDAELMELLDGVEGEGTEWYINDPDRPLDEDITSFLLCTCEDVNNRRVAMSK